MENVLEVSGLYFSYGSRTVLKDVSFSVQKGDFAGVIGPNGSGKSTLIKLCLKLLPLSAGQICLFGEDIAHFRNWSKIGYIAQRNAIPGGFPASVQEVVAANLYARTGFLHITGKEQKKSVQRALETVGLSDFGKKKVSDLSGGEQQRVSLARVLVNEPELLFLDEPATGMDAQSENSLYDLLNRLNREYRLTILMVTHDITAVTAYAGRLFCMGGQGLTEHDLKEGLSDAVFSELYGRDVHLHVHDAR